MVQFLEGAPTTADGALIATRIADWDGVCDEASVGCAAFNAWQYRVLRDIFDDDLGPLARDYVGSPFSWVVLQGLLDDPTSAWWDDTGTTGVTETADDIVGRAMDEAGAELRAAVGAPDGWTWGRLHTATFREATLGTSGIGTARVVLQRRSPPGLRARPARSTTRTSGSRRPIRTRTTRPSCRSASTTSST